MKRIIATSAAALVVLAGAASAMTGPSNTLINDVRAYAPNADLSALTDEQIKALGVALEDDSDESFAQIKSRVQFVINPR